uniref:FP protein C-terminal domain-containing protein n=1 Tax=Heliothis virescens TaxID=7102 RepID=A0A2A4IZJ0_HELVI
MAQKIGVPLGENDLDCITRVGPRQQRSASNTEIAPRQLVVRFVRRYKRNEFMQALKTRRNLTSTDIEIEGPTRKLYCNERLTRENRQLFRACRTSAKENGYKFCWTKNGSIYIRKQEGNPTIQIRNSDDLLRLMPAHPTLDNSPDATACPTSPADD